MELRKRLLLILMAVSMMLAYDLVVNGRYVVNTFLESYIQPTPVRTMGRGISEDAPFVRKVGSYEEPASGVQSLVVRGLGDMEVVRSSTPTITLEYEIRTYGMSGRHVHDFHEATDVDVVRDGNRLEFALRTPPVTREVEGARVQYRLAVPDGLRIEFVGGYGDIRLYGVRGDITLTNSQGSVRVGDHIGSVTVDVERGDVWLNGVEGNVRLAQADGRVEIVEINGAVDFKGHRSTIVVDRVRGSVDVDVERGGAAIYNVEGGLNVAARMARVSVVEGDGTIELDGSLSPVEIRHYRGPIDVKSDRAHVQLQLHPTESWAVDLNAKGGEVLLSSDLAALLGDGKGVRQLQGTVGDAGGARSLSVQVRGGDIELSR